MVSSIVTVPRQRPTEYFFGSSTTEESSDDMCLGARALVDYNVNINSPLISLCASPTHPDTFYALQASGECMSIVIRDELMENLIMHKYENDEGEERRVESLIYLRNLSDAYLCLTQLLKESQKLSPLLHPHEVDLIQLCTGKAAIPSSSWAIGEGSDKVKEMIDKFEKDLEIYGYHLPPGYNQMMSWYKMVSTFIFTLKKLNDTKIPEKTRLGFETIVFRYNLVRNMMERDWEKIILNEKQMFAAIETNPKLLHAMIYKVSS